MEKWSAINEVHNPICVDFSEEIYGLSAIPGRSKTSSVSCAKDTLLDKILEGILSK